LGLAGIRRDGAEFDGRRHWKIKYESGEFHVPGQEEIRIFGSGVFIFFFDDGTVSSLSMSGSVRTAVRRDELRLEFQAG
jgi:hypothetical protein